MTNTIESAKVQAMNIVIDAFVLEWKEQMRPETNRHGVENIIQDVCDEFGISFERMTTKTRIREVIIPRQIACWMIKSKLVRNDFSLEGIGRMLGGFDYTTVLHSIKVVNEQIETNKAFREDMMRRCARLGVTMEYNGKNLVPVKFAYLESF